MSGLTIYSGLHMAQPKTIKLTRLPGDRVMTEQMSFRTRDVDRYGGKEQVMAFIKAALLRQFHLRDVDVAILQTVDCKNPGHANFCCLAYLKGNKEPATEAAAMKFYPNIFTAPRAETPEIPDYIDV